MLDPVDGTTNLIHDYRSSAISLALFEGRKTGSWNYLSAIYKGIILGSRKENGAFLGTERISVSEAGSLSESIDNVGTSPI